MAVGNLSHEIIYSSGVDSVQMSRDERILLVVPLFVAGLFVSVAWSAVNDTDEWPSTYSKFFIELDDGVELSFTDKRRFARVRLLKNPASVPPISELGPDALLEPMTIDEFIISLSKKKIGIKALLLDQSFISGIGNWIADEVLYQARIHPMEVVSSLSKEGCVALHKCIKEVVQFAVEVDADCTRFPLEWLFHFRWGKRPGRVNGKMVIGKAVEVGADSSQFPSSWIFHSREKKPGKAFVDGKKIEFITAGGRTTAFVPELQNLSGSQAAKAPSKPRNRSKGNKEEDGDDNLKNSVASEEEENVKSIKSKGGKSTSRRGPKIPPAKRKFNKTEKEDDDDDDVKNDDDDNYGKKTRTVKYPPGKRKSKKATK
ncbi:Formamidopyrimidine-DNA glycosylase [Sarracenia purpurea var. burkii]